MDFKAQAVADARLSTVAADALVLILPASAQGRGLEPAVQAAVRAAKGCGDFDWKAGKAVVLHHVAGMACVRLVLVAVADDSFKAYRKGLMAAWMLLRSGGSREVAVRWCGASWAEQYAQATVLTAHEACYQYRHTKPSAGPAAQLKRITCLVASASLSATRQALGQAQQLAAGVDLAREWANRPANHCTPTLLARQAQAVGRECGVTVKVLDKPALQKLGMGSFLAVAQGSEQAPKFIVMEYLGAGKGTPPVVLVGKGITFDTGGISLKPAAEMDEMKFDMGGAASVLGTLRAVAGMKAKVNLVGLIPACENMPSGRAVKPGDVVTSMSGQTIEILNTDAEGRLILCDALTYSQRYKPQAVVDIATLTGACVIALGHHRSGLFCPDDSLAQQLIEAGERSADPCWRMPLDDEYDEALKSNFADMANVGPRAGGAITAAMFLKRFTQTLPWAHLDIAGTAWKSGAAKGGTGRPVPLLTQFVLSRSKGAARG